MIDDTPELPTAPRDVIEHIRRFEFGIGASLQGDGRVIVANVHRKTLGLAANICSHRSTSTEQ